jgi:antitoxin VapB
MVIKEPAMGMIETRVFKAGDGAAVHLPKELGLEPGTAVTIEKTSGGLTIRPVERPETVRRDMAAAMQKIAAIWEEMGGRPSSPEVRDPDIFPDRPGLY